jgi:RNA polymerase sigma factor (sigma-70 family)
MPLTVPPSLLIVLEVLRPCFTAPSFATMSALVTGALSASGPRTVTGMWQAAGLAGRAHWSRAHRFFSRAVWDLDAVGLALARAVAARLAPDGAAVTLAVDDTLLHRYGRKVHGAKYQHDGSAKGRDGIGRGNCFVIVGIVAAVPFLARQVCLPVLFRLHIPKTSASKTEQARAMVDLLAQALPGRTIHVVGDALYRGPAWRGLPARVTFTTRLAANAVLYRPEPARTGRRGHPAWKGGRLGTAADMAATATWTRTRVTRYGVTEDVDMAVVTCLWWGSLHRTPIRVVLIRDTGEAQPYTLALATTDMTATGEQIVARYASRWSIEQSIKDGKNLLGAGDAQSRNGWTHPTVDDEFSAIRDAVTDLRIEALYQHRLHRPVWETQLRGTSVALLSEPAGWQRSDNGVVSIELADTLVTGFEAVTSEVEYSDCAEIMQSVLHTLSERERKVIWLYASGYSKVQIARDLGLTRYRIDRVVSKTLSKLRHPSRSQKLYDYHDGWY